MINGSCVAFATSCTYHLSANLEDSSTKDDTGDFQLQQVVGLAGDISCDALYSVENGPAMLNLLLAGAEVDVTFTPTGGAQNRVPSGTGYSCKALVNDISVNAPNRQNVTYTIQMQMNSKPTTGTVSSSDI